jgi:hypothetical protein
MLLMAFCTKMSPWCPVRCLNGAVLRVYWVQQAVEMTIVAEKKRKSLPPKRNSSEQSECATGPGIAPLALSRSH